MCCRTTTKPLDNQGPADKTASNFSRLTSLAANTLFPGCRASPSSTQAFWHCVFASFTDHQAFAQGWRRIHNPELFWMVALLHTLTGSFKPRQAVSPGRSQSTGLQAPTQRGGLRLHTHGESVSKSYQCVFASLFGFVKSQPERSACRCSVSLHEAIDPLTCLSVGFPAVHNRDDIPAGNNIRYPD